MPKKFIFIIIFLSCTFSSFSQNNGTVVAQKDTSNLIQLTGIVITDSLMRVPFTRVADQSTRRGTIADYFGYFALVVHPGDTIEFACLGYKRKTYIVPDTLDEKEISLVQVMTEDTIQMDPVEVYPWPSREQFATAFVNMDIPDDDMRRAQKRLSPQEMAFVGALLASDGTSSYSAYRIEQYQEFYTRGQSPVNNLLNPAAWSEFLQGIGTGRYQISQ
jgi:hypothetical protein